MTDTKTPRLLILSPAAPPSIGAESIVFRRFLWELDKHCDGQVFRTSEASNGWSRQDASMQMALEHLEMNSLSMPFHSLALRIIRSKYANFLKCPDAEIWLQYMTRSVLKRITQKPDLLYTRFSPFGAAMLALKLKRHLQIPWIMHMSDPWLEMPPNHWRNSTSLKLRDKCFATADKIALTTPEQAQMYQKQYPAFAHKMFVSANPVPQENELGHLRARAVIPSDDLLHIVFTGSVYGLTSFEPFIHALQYLADLAPQVLQQLRIDVYGNLIPSVAATLAGNFPMTYHGGVSYDESCIQQLQADVLLTVDADERDLHRSMIILQTKLVGYIGCMRPVLAVTCKGSVTDTLCKAGYGWSVAHRDTQQLAELLMMLVEQRAEIRSRREWKQPPEHLRAAPIVGELLEHMQQLIAQHKGAFA